MDGDSKSGGCFQYSVLVRHGQVSNYQTYQCSSDRVKWIVLSHIDPTEHHEKCKKIERYGESRLQLGGDEGEGEHSDRMAAGKA